MQSIYEKGLYLWLKAYVKILILIADYDTKHRFECKNTLL